MGEIDENITRQLMSIPKGNLADVREHRKRTLKNEVLKKFFDGDQSTNDRGRLDRL